MPNVPTTTKAGLPSSNYDVWIGIFVLLRRPEQSSTGWRRSPSKKTANPLLTFWEVPVKRLDDTSLTVGQELRHLDETVQDFLATPRTTIER